jgi:hypothetical protein
MKPPGLQLRAFCLRWCSERTLRRLVDPALADLQMEYAAARRAGSRMRAVSTLAAGYLALAKVLLLASISDAGQALRTWEPEEAAGLRSGVRMALGLLVASTALLMAPLITQMAWMLETLDWKARTLAAAQLVPSSLPITAPYSLGVAAAWMLWGAARTRKVAATVLVVAALASAVTFVGLAWVVPEANHAFRQRAFAALSPNATSPLARGMNELTLPQAQQRRHEVRARGNAEEIRTFETWYYRRFAIGMSPLAVAGLIVAIAFRRRWTRAGLTTVAFAICIANYALLMSAPWMATRGLLPPIVLGWSGDVICALATVLLATGARRAGPASAPPPAPIR